MDTKLYVKEGNVIGVMHQTNFKIYDESQNLIFDSTEKDNKSILLIRRGKEITAYDIVTGKKGVAKCHPDDKFDFSTGAQIALDRMNAYNAKIVCVDSRYSHVFKKGKIYIVKDGEICSTNRIPVNKYDKMRYKNIDEINKNNWGQFIEIIED